MSHAQESVLEPGKSGNDQQQQFLGGVCIKLQGQRLLPQLGVEGEGHSSPNTCVLNEGFTKTKDNYYTVAGNRECQGEIRMKMGNLV